MSYTRGLDQRIFEMSSWNENEVEIHLKFYSVLNVQNVLDRSFMACLGVSCLHWARTMFPDCFCPTEVFLVWFYAAGRQHTKQIYLSITVKVELLDFILSELFLDHVCLIIGFFLCLDATWHLLTINYF